MCALCTTADSLQRQLHSNVSDGICSTSLISPSDILAVTQCVASFSTDVSDKLSLLLLCEFDVHEKQQINSSHLSYHQR